MAQWIEITAKNLFDGDSRTLWKGLTDTVTAFEVNASDPNRGLVEKTNSWGKTLWKRVVVKGNHAYRITSGGVRKVPLVQNDPDAPRRLARTLGWPLTWIVILGDNETFNYRPRCQGDDGIYSLREGVNIDISTMWTNGNPERITRIFVREGASPSWEEAKEALCLLASERNSFEEAVEKYRLG